jgi:hypothetical protein
MQQTDLFSGAEIHRVSKCLVYLFTCLAIFTLTVGADHKTDDSISLTVNNQPLSLVMQQLSEITGCKITYDKSWADRDITVRVQNLSLDKTLRKILNNFNFTILYQEDGHVRIKLYESTGNNDAYHPAQNDRPVYQQINSSPLHFENEGNERGSEPADDVAESDTEISENSSDEKNSDTEDGDKEGTASEDEQAGDTESGEEEGAGSEDRQAIEENNENDEDEQEAEGEKT